LMGQLPPRPRLREHARIDSDDPLYEDNPCPLAGDPRAKDEPRPRRVPTTAMNALMARQRHLRHERKRCAHGCVQ